MDLFNYNLGIRFSKVAAQYPESIALAYPDRQEVSFNELENRSNQIARFLTERGIKKNDVVAILNRKSPHAFALMLACLKLGAIYTNLDTSSPVKRLVKILERCEPSCLVNDLSSNEILNEIKRVCNIPSFSFSTGIKQEISEYRTAPIDELQNVTGSDPAYIMFTSGSTGFPKGAVISHSNLLNFIKWGKWQFNVQPDDIFTNVNPIYFDNSVFDFYVSLFNGASVVPFGSELTKQPMKLVEKVEEAKCNSWFSVPSMLVYLLTTKAITQGRLPDIERFIFGGEGFPKAKLKLLFDQFSDSAALYNVYGPTECTCICSCYQISEDDFDDMTSLAPLGYLSPNFDYEILALDEGDPHFGELALKGPNVGLGYYKDQQKTDESFAQSSQNGEYNELMYKTGDLVEEDAAGQLHFRGRIDNQIKHMGYRIELEEIESAFNSMQNINESAVVYNDMGNGLGRIEAFVNVASTEDSSLIKEEVKQILPEYMVPKKINTLDVLPKNQNGKIDRKELEKRVNNKN